MSEPQLNRNKEGTPDRVIKRVSSVSHLFPHILLESNVYTKHMLNVLLYLFRLLFDFSDSHSLINVSIYKLGRLEVRRNVVRITSFTKLVECQFTGSTTRPFTYLFMRHRWST